MAITVRTETLEDLDKIHSLTCIAFGQRGEADLVDMLRGEGDLVVSLVAEENGKIVGHVALSKMVEPSGALALAPVSVDPIKQRAGIGSRLIQAAHAIAEQDGWHTVFVLGDPNYYQRFGFRHEIAASFNTPYPKEFTMALELKPNSLDDLPGQLVYPAAFSKLD